MVLDERIEALGTATVRTIYPRTVGRNARLGSHGSGFESTVAVLRTESGASGWGPIRGDLRNARSAVGRPIGELFEAETGLLDGSLSAIDFALHDLAAKLLGQPVHRMLGGRGAEQIPCYSGAIYFDDLDPDSAPRGIDAVLENCAADFAAGFRAFKLKIGRGNKWMSPAAGFARDVEVTQAVRSAYPEAKILVDANDGYTPGVACDFLDAVADCDIYWIEEPFAEGRVDSESLRAHLQRTESKVLVADGEFEPDLAQVMDLAQAGLLDVLLMDVVDFGLTPWRALMPIIEEAGAVASPHAWGMPLKTLWAAQMAAGLGNVNIVEGVPGLTEGVDTSAYGLVNGEIQVPSSAGAGMELTAPVTFML